jgi:hypothetical protein
MIVLLVFVLIAQVTTNLTINILPPALIFMDTFRMTWPQGVLLSGVLGVLSCPWLLMSNFNAFLGFILNYSALFGPMLGVMLADYYVIRKRRLDVAELYNTSANSPFWYQGGFNLAGYVAVLVPGLITMIWYLKCRGWIGLPAGFGCCTSCCTRGSRPSLRRRLPPRAESRTVGVAPDLSWRCSALSPGCGVAQLRRGGLVDAAFGRDHDAEVALRRLARQVTVQHVVTHELGRALERSP